MQLPRDRRPKPQDLAEHLADLGRGGEIAIRIMRRVIRGVGARHEVIEAFHHRLRRISHGRPAISIGMHSNWPMVTPPIR